MKRSVAVIGPTPQFLRWSIERPCALRQIDQQRLPDVTFRQLRGVREFSVAAQEGRVFEDTVLHSHARSESPNDAMGFGEDEVLEVFGGRATIDELCLQCPANTDAEEPDKLWAGCYGLLTANGSTWTAGSFASRSEDEQTDDFLVREVDYAIEMLNIRALIRANVPLSRPAWYGFWQAKTLTVPQLLLLEKVFSAVLRRHETQADPQYLDDLIRFFEALTLSHRHGLPMHVELVPAGYSDGSQWTIFPYCERCKFSASEQETAWVACPVCEKPGPPHNARKSKVLGLRPYVNLSRIMGLEQTQSLLKRYEAQQNRVADAKVDGAS